MPETVVLGPTVRVQTPREIRDGETPVGGHLLFVVFSARAVRSASLFFTTNVKYQSPVQAPEDAALLAAILTNAIQSQSRDPLELGPSVPREVTWQNARNGLVKFTEISGAFVEVGVFIVADGRRTERDIRAAIMAEARSIAADYGVAFDPETTDPLRAISLADVDEPREVVNNPTMTRPSLGEDLAEAGKRIPGAAGELIGGAAGIFGEALGAALSAFLKKAWPVVLVLVAILFAYFFFVRG